MKHKYPHIRSVLFLPLISILLLIAGCASTAKPGVSEKEVLVWTNEALLATLTYDYANYQQQLQAASQYYTPESWKAYLSALNASGTLRMVTAKRMVVSAVPQGTPLILSEGLVNYRYSWRIQVPMLITYESPFTRKEQPTLVTLLVMRVDDQLGVRGLAVDQLVIQERESPHIKNWRSK